MVLIQSSSRLAVVALTPQMLPPQPKRPSVKENTANTAKSAKSANCVKDRQHTQMAAVFPMTPHAPTSAFANVRPG